MSQTILPIAVDAMGADEGPEGIIQGVIDSEQPAIIVGPENVINPVLANAGSPDHIEVLHTDEEVDADDTPFSAFRAKKNSSMMMGIKLVRDGKASGVLSTGNTGAFMAGATMILGRLPHVSRPAAAIPIPSATAYSLLLDAGASTDCTPTDIMNFAIMGSIYVESVWGIQNPRVGMLSIGEEAIKGTKTARSAHQVLKDSGINFVGNVQGDDLGKSVADVIVTDGFTGNVALKVAEGLTTLMTGIVKTEIKRAPLNERIAAWVLYPMFKRIKKRFDWQEYGGGSLLGVKGIVIIAHGKSGRRAIKNAVKLASDLAKTDLVRNLEESLKKYYGSKPMDRIVEESNNTLEMADKPVGEKSR